MILACVTCLCNQFVPFIPPLNTPGEGLHRVTLSIGSLGDTKKASGKTPLQDRLKRIRNMIHRTAARANVGWCEIVIDQLICAKLKNLRSTCQAMHTTKRLNKLLTFFMCNILSKQHL